jgi:SAM-dependent methyltransferase
MKATNDHFSSLAQSYAQYRPGYPSSLFEHIADLAPSTGCAWDCATGSGQAAVELARHFELVIATDASARQIESARPRKNVEYRVGAAEKSGLPDSCADVVTVAQALHWFDFDRFYGEVNRVLKPGGIIAVWSYELFTIDPGIDPIVNRLYSEPLGPYWPPERRHVENGYRNIPFPFEQLPAPAFHMSARWDLPRLLGYLRTWSAVKRYREAEGRDPVDLIHRELSAAWTEADSALTLKWPLTLRLGRAA